MTVHVSSQLQLLGVSHDAPLVNGIDVELWVFLYAWCKYYTHLTRAHNLLESHHLSPTLPKRQLQQKQRELPQRN